MNLELRLIGLNHKTAGVDVRERYALSHVENPGSLVIGDAVGEVMVLSTCNRVEILAVGEDGEGVEERVLAAWARACQSTADELAPHVYVHRNLEAVKHVFRVASSLDSMVVGEPQILGQLKDAYRQALESGTARTVVNRLLHKAFFVAKRVRSQTGIASAAVSISYVAVELAKRIFGELDGKRAMLIGAGEMAELAATHLLSCGVAHISVANRTLDRAAELAEKFKGAAVPFDKLYDELPGVDIVISSTGAPRAVIHARDVKAVLKRRKNRPMFFIDIAVPRDIDPDVNGLDNVYLYDIDDLREVVEENMAQRQEEALKADAIVSEEATAFGVWLDSLSLEPTIKDLLAVGEMIGERELAKTLKRLENADEETEQALRKLVVSLVEKLYREPIVYLKRRAREEGAGDRYIDITRRMFNLDREDVPSDAHAGRKKGKRDK